VVFSAQSVSEAALATVECVIPSLRKQLHCNRVTVFSTRSVPRSYNQDKLGVR
jgi:hypothetical protein